MAHRAETWMPPVSLRIREGSRIDPIEIFYAHDIRSNRFDRNPGSCYSERSGFSRQSPVGCLNEHYASVTGEASIPAFVAGQ